jgi:hypothetical protein
MTTQKNAMDDDLKKKQKTTTSKKMEDDLKKIKDDHKYNSKNQPELAVT